MPGATSDQRLGLEDRVFLDSARRAHLATASADGRPHVVPVCFALLDDATVVFAIDEKPKPRGRALRRLRNLSENDRFSLLVDRWDEDWSRLAFLMIEGRGALSEDAARSAAAIDALRARYPQYVRMGLIVGRHPVVELAIERVHRWGPLA